jgi:hypothetical protein
MNYEIHADALWLIPVVFALIFMLWAIWELEKQIRLEKRRSNALAHSDARSKQPPQGPQMSAGEARAKQPNLSFRKPVFR